MGRGDDTPGGVDDLGAHEEDGPVTWEVLSIPQEKKRCNGEPAGERNLRRVREYRWMRVPAKNNHLLRGRSKARGTGAETEGGQEVGGLNTSDDVGERLAPGPGRAKAARASTNFRRET